MKTYCRRLVLVLALAGCALAGGDAQEAKGPAKDVLDLARDSEAGKDVSKTASALSQRYRNPRVAMRLYNARRWGGIGFGPKGTAMEHRLVDLGEKPVSAADLKKEEKELIRLAHVNLVVAEITRGLAPEKPILGRGSKEWLRDVEAVKAGSQSLLQAVRAGDPKAVQVAAVRINHACDSCHDGKP